MMQPVNLEELDPKPEAGFQQRMTCMAGVPHLKAHANFLLCRVEHKIIALEYCGWHIRFTSHACCRTPALLGVSRGTFWGVPAQDRTCM